MTEYPEIRLRAAAPSDADDVIALSIETFRAEHAPSQRAFHERQAEWREDKSPTVVARDGDGAFLGYAFSRPNEAGDFERTDGQVAVLTQVIAELAILMDELGDVGVVERMRKPQAMTEEAFVDQADHGMLGRQGG